MANLNGSRSTRARALAAALRKAREERGISNRELAGRLAIDQAHLSRVETGKRVPNPEMTALILGELRTPPKERDRILELARHASDPNWLTVGIPGIPQQLAGAWECERAATRITEWHQSMIPGLLQTIGYARALITATVQVDNIQDEQSIVESRVAVKAARREIITGRKPVQFRALISESAVRDPIAPPDVMVEQLRHVIDVSAAPSVSIRVVPRDIGYHPGLSGPFVLYEFDDAPPVVHFEHHSSAAFDQNEDDIDSYRRAISALNSVARSEQESADFIAQVMVEKWSN